MVSFLRKAVLVIMVAASTVSFSACIGEMNKKNAEEVAGLLQEKYAAEFVVDSIGNRLASDRADNLTAYCHPKDDPDVVFEAKMNVDRELIYDDYPESILENELREYIVGAFGARGVKAGASVSAAKMQKPAELLYPDFKTVISENPEMYVTFSTVVGSDADPEKTYDAVCEILNDLYSGNEKMGLGTTIRIIDEAKLDECISKMNSLPYVSKTFFNQFDPLGSINVAMVNGEISISKSDFIKEFDK